MHQRGSISTTAPPDPLLSTLNKAQCRAVTSQANTVAILAGPGSGKTHTLTSRVIWLIDRVGYRPDDVIVATFTVKAAREMKERIRRVVSDGREKKIILGTFHSVARRYLAAYGSCIGLKSKFGIADDNDSRSIVRRIIARLQLGLDAAAARSWISKKKSKSTAGEPSASQALAKMRHNNKELERCYEEYQGHLERSNLLDYDDLLVRCVELLRKNPSCVSNIQAVLVDEYQDTNGIQYELMRLFAQTRRRVTIVGDPDQSIYGWRSAEIKNLYRMLKEYPGTEEVSLEENYRSSQAILDVSLSVIQQDTKRYQKVLLPVHGRGSRPVLRRLRTSADEADWIVGEIRRITMMMGNMATFDDIAILLRQASLSRHVEASLGRAGISYRVVGGLKFYDRVEIKILLDYLRVVYQPDNNDALVRIINVPKRGIGEITVKSLLEEAEMSNLSVWTLLGKHCRGDRRAKTNITNRAEQNISGGLLRIITQLAQKVANDGEQTSFDLEGLVNKLLADINFQKYLQETYSEEYDQRWANVQEFVNLARDFVQEFRTAEEEALPDIEGLQQARETDTLGRFLANVSLASDVQTKGKAEETNKPLVTISTIHAAKGLEWPVIFAPSVYDGMIPHGRSEDLDEDRRLLYVAMTRAKVLLYLSCPSYNARGDRVEQSQFLSSATSAFFARKGPSFDNHVLREAGRILGRAVISQEDIFRNLPAMFSPEDDKYPLDPEGSKDGGRTHQDGHRPKKVRTENSQADADSTTEPTWHRGYTTTMGRASNFTMPSTGFITAGAHHAALTAAAEARRAQQVPIKRRADQKSIIGYMAPSSRQGSYVARLPSAQPSRSDDLGLPHEAQNFTPRTGKVAATSVEPPSIAPELVGRRLGRPQATRKPRTPAWEKDRPKGHYACFSSSPLRAASAGESEGPDECNALPEPLVRPAATLHVTTATTPGRIGGFRKPAGLTREGIAPMERLRRPFKPLTINRSGGDAP